MNNKINNCVVIYNPVSTGFKNKNLDIISKVLKESGLNPKVIRSEYEGHIPKLVKIFDDDNTLVLTMGGDGTVSEAYSGFMETTQKGVYAHVPTGTTNDMAKNYDVDSSKVETITRDILNGEIVSLDTFMVNDKAAAYSAVFGHLAYVPYITSPFMKKHFGHAGYVLSGMKDLVKKPPVYDVSYQADNNEGRCCCMLGAVSNSKGFAGINLYKDARLDDGKIELLLLKNLTAKTIFDLFKDYLKDDINLSKYQDNVVFERAKKISITFNDDFPSYPVDIDGENSGILPEHKDRNITFEVGKPVTVLKKRRN